MKAVAQTGPANKSTTANKGAHPKPLIEPNDPRTAAELFTDADNYTKNKFAEFEKQHMPFDGKLADKIKQEQRNLAAAYANFLAARKPNSQDVYYVGMLYNLAKDFDHAMEAMRQYLTENPATSGEPAQNARAIFVIQAAKKGLFDEAERRLTEYAKDKPQVADDRYALENWVGVGFFKVKNYERALPHAREMWTAAKEASKKKPSAERDEMLNEAMTLLSETLFNLKQKGEAVAAVQEMQKLAMTLPSGTLYKMALRRLLQLDPSVDLFKTISDQRETTIAPEISAQAWIDLEPTKLSDLRGKVVLLDFWAPWCGPCRVTFPRLQKWHADYKDKGLVIIGLTDFYGNVEGKQLTHEQELDYLRDFKKKFRLPYGFAVTDSEDNDSAYSVSSIPTTFLIDRQGLLRFISVGSSEEENAALGRMIKRVVEEPAPSVNTSTNR